MTKDKNATFRKKHKKSVNESKKYLFLEIKKYPSWRWWCPGNCPPDNCPRGKLLPPPRIIAPWMIAPDLLLLDTYPKDNYPLTIYPWKLPQRKIVFRLICRLHNCPSDKWSREKLPSRKIVPRINYIRDIFSSRIRNCNTLTDSCILLFSLFVV